MPSKKIRTLFITHYAEMYGANKSLIDIIHGLHEYNIEPYVLCNEEGDLTKYLSAQKIVYIISPFKIPFEYRWKSTNKAKQFYHDCNHFFNGINRKLINRKLLKGICKEVSLLNIQIVFTNSSVITIGEEIANQLQLPHIHQVRELPVNQFSLFPDFGASAYRNTLSKSDVVIFNSNYTKSTFFQPRSEFKKELIIYDEIERPKILGKVSLDKDYFTIGVFGYMSKQKNQIEAIRAISMLKIKEHVKLYIIGGGNPDPYKEEARQLGVEPQIVLVGFTNDVASYYNELDLIVVSATNEALGRITIESMLWKKPVIGKRSGATTELIKDGETGLLYDSVNELAEKITVLYENEEVSDYLALKGKQYAVTNFSSGKSISVLSAVIKNLV